MAVKTSTRKTWWSRLIMGINNFMNPNHAWRDYENDPDASGTILDTVANGLAALNSEGVVESLVNKWTGNSLTGAENEANAFNAEEAQKSRDFTEYMARNKYAMETQSMQEAGVNPAMVYGGGSLVPTASNGAQASSVNPQSGTSFGDLSNAILSLVRMPLEMQKLKAEIRNTDSDTAKKEAETGSINAKLPFEVDELKSRIRNANVSSDAQEILNKYIDRQQEAEIRMKNATANEADVAVNKIWKEIEKMDFEEVTMYIGWLETNEKILTLQKNRELTDKQIDELSSLIAVNNKTAKKLGLDISNYDDITVIGNATHNIKLGPISIGEGEPITLGVLKAAREYRGDLKEKEGKKKDKGSYPSTNKSAYDGPVYD